MTSNMALHHGPLEDAAWIAWSASRGRVASRTTGKPDTAKESNPRPYVVLFSGGNDSSTLATVMSTWGITRIAAHANTGIGVERTREHVRATSSQLGMKLHEAHPDSRDSYENLVLAEGFPGPAMHFKMYQRLKERALRKVRSLYVTNPRRQRVVFVAGRRRQESARRIDVPLLEREGSVVWVSPIATWSADEMAAIRDRFNVRRNPVSDELGMSGECLCGAFADVGEFERIAQVDPDSAAQISNLQEKAREAGIPFPKCLWGWGAYRNDPDAQGAQDVRVGPMCSSCDARRDSEVRVADLFRPIPAIFAEAT